MHGSFVVVFSVYLLSMCVIPLRIAREVSTVYQRLWGKSMWENAQKKTLPLLIKGYGTLPKFRIPISREEKSSSKKNWMIFLVIAR